MTTFLILLIILLIFMVFFVVAWFWYLSNETNIAQRFMSVAVMAFDKENYSKAIPLLLRALKFKKDSRDVLLKLGKSYVETKNYSQAKEIFERLLKINPKDCETLFNYAQMLRADEQYEKATELYNKALAEHPGSPDCYFNLGLLSFSEKQYEKALESFTQAHKFAPDRVDAEFYIVKSKDELCDYNTPEEGQAIIDEYLSLSAKPDLPTSYAVDLARAYAKNGQMGQAFNECKEALNTDDKDVEGYKLLGLIELLKKEPAEAKKLLSTAISIDMRDEELHNILSYVLCQHDDRCLVDTCRQKYHETIEKLMKKK